MVFTQYTGPSSNYPPKESWLDYDTLFNIFNPFMLEHGDSGSDVGNIYEGIKQAAQQIGVEERVILCIIIKESSGYVGIDVPNDSDGKPTGGLMQAEESQAYPGQNNLSQDQISGMIMAGTGHFKTQCLEPLGNGDDADTIYKALRVYNSGPLNDPNNLNDDWTGSDHSDPNYVSTIANYLQGVVG